MTTLTITRDAVLIRLGTAEKIGSAHGDVAVPRTAITSVEVVDDALAAAHGVRFGLGMPGRRKLGIWRGRDGREFVDVRRGQPAVRLWLSGQRYDSILVGVDDPQAVLDTLAS